MNEFNITGKVAEFHQGKYRATITLTTPDGRITRLESDKDYPFFEEAKSDMNEMLERILTQFKSEGTEVLKRTETNS